MHSSSTGIHQRNVCVVICAGYGVFTTKTFPKGEFVLDYFGELIEPEVAEVLEDQTYIYYFQLGPKHFM
jgi:hypothetical protein